MKMQKTLLLEIWDICLWHFILDFCLLQYKTRTQKSEALGSSNLEMHIQGNVSRPHITNLRNKSQQISISYPKNLWHVLGQIEHCLLDISQGFILFRTHPDFLKSKIRIEKKVIHSIALVGKGRIPAKERSSCIFPIFGSSMCQVRDKILVRRSPPTLATETLERWDTYLMYWYVANSLFFSGTDWSLIFSRVGAATNYKKSLPFIHIELGISAFGACLFMQANHMMI